MSRANRLREFQRLKDLGREKDIPQNLWDEFQPKDKIAMPVKEETPKKKKKVKDE